MRSSLRLCREKRKGTGINGGKRRVTESHSSHTPARFSVLNRFCPFSSVLPSQSLTSVPIPPAQPETLFSPSSGITGNTKSTGRERAKKWLFTRDFPRIPRRKKLPALPVIPELPVFPVPQPIISVCAHPIGSAGKNGREQESTVENGKQQGAFLRAPRRIHRSEPFLSVFVRSPQPILSVCSSLRLCRERFSARVLGVLGILRVLRESGQRNGSSQGLFPGHPGAITVSVRFCPFSSVLPSQSLASVLIPPALPGTQHLTTLTESAPGRGGTRRSCSRTTGRAGTCSCSPGPTGRRCPETQTDSRTRGCSNSRRA